MRFSTLKWGFIPILLSLPFIASLAMDAVQQNAAEQPWTDVNTEIQAWLETVEEEDKIAKQANPTRVTNELIDINRADVNELMRLNGIGPTKAQAIVKYREQHGPFRRKEDIMQVKGIGPATFDKMKDKIILRTGKND
jgi:competence ComEA-like helix-hairpin-helix protein